MRLWTSCLFLTTLSLGVAFGQAQSRVRIQVTDAYGKRVPAQRITMSANGTAKEVPQDEAISAKYGRYTIVVDVLGFSTATESVIIDQPEQVVPVAMRLGVMEVPPPHCSVNGHISHGSALSVRLLQVFGSYKADVPVSASGFFEFRDLECGDYLLVAISANHCVGTRLFRATPTARVADIQLGSESLACTPSDDRR